MVLNPPNLEILQVAGYLKETWVVTLKNAITNTFKDTGKGWFNVYKQSHEIHDFSKMKKFLMMTKFMMEDSLRFLVEDSLMKCVRAPSGFLFRV